jgi:hypothetical protein
MWSWSDQAHLQAGQGEIEDATRGDLAGAFEAEVARQQERRQPAAGAAPRPWHFGLVGVLAVLAVLLVLAH